MNVVDETRARLRGIPARDPSWRVVHYEALALARRSNDRNAVVELSTLAAARLVSYGQDREAAAYLDLAAAYASSPDDRAHVLNLRAASLISGGALSEADSAIAEARALGRLTPDAALEVEVYADIADCAALREIDCRAVVSVGVRAQVAGKEHWFSGLMRWLIPAMFAAGRADEARPLIDLLEIGARDVTHPWRISDVAVFREGLACLDSTSGPRLDDRETAHAPEHRVRLAILGVYGGLHGGPESPDAMIEAIACETSDLLSDLRTTLDGFGHLVDAVGGRMVHAPVPPPTATLSNLAGALATAEAVALAGPADAVTSWSRWVETQPPPHIVTSLEWPVPVAYVRSLFALRRGDRASADALLSEARRGLADGRGCAVCLGRIAHAIAPQGGLSGFEPTHLHSNVALRRLLAPPRSVSPLTAREMEVIVAFGAGLSLKATAVHLGISWQTVRVHARNAYRKLGAHSRGEAIESLRHIGQHWQSKEESGMQAIDPS